MPNFSPELVFERYYFDNKLFRRLANGQLDQVSTFKGGRLVTRLKGQFVHAADIAWCLHYGNWPKYPLAVLGDPDDLRLENLWPARRKVLRRRFTLEGTDWFHPLSKTGFKTMWECAADWRLAAMDYYRRDLALVLAEEAQERALRTKTLEAKPELKPKFSHIRPKPAARPPKPPCHAGYQTFWYEGQWVVVPEPVHVSDDWKVRCQRVLAGANLFDFDPVTQTTVQVG